MTGSFCPFCGKPTIPGATFCASCGAALPGASASSGTVPSAPPFAPGPGSAPLSFAGYPVAPNPSSRRVDLNALESVEWAAILSLVGAVLSLVVLFGTNATTFVSVTSAGPATGVTIVLSALYLFAAVAGIGLALTIVELVLYRRAFRDLAPVDSRFSTPASLVLLELIGVVLLAGLALGLIWLLFQAIACAGSGAPITTACLNVSTALDLLGLVVVVAIVVVIGYIGFLIGIWRLGTRYDESLFKVGAILLIFPVLNLIGTILVLVAAHSAKSRFAAAGPPSTFG